MLARREGCHDVGSAIEDAAGLDGGDTSDERHKKRHIEVDGICDESLSETQVS
jgi:hypothetical protein